MNTLKLMIVLKTSECYIQDAKLLKTWGAYVNINLNFIIICANVAFIFIETSNNNNTMRNVMMLSACMVDLLACVSMPCQNNGLCEGTNTTYSCTCLAGTTGFNCELLISGTFLQYNDICFNILKCIENKYCEILKSYDN